MDVRAIIARRTDDGIKGVYHRHESHPAALGNALLYEVLIRKGDVAGLVAEVVDHADGGWAFFPERRKVEREVEDPPVLRLRDLESQVWVEWLYVFDEAERTLEVWSQPRSAELGPPLHTVRFAADGQGTPSMFPGEQPALPRARTLKGYKGDRKDDRELRDRIEAELEGAAPEAVEAAFIEGLGAAIGDADWETWTEDPLERQLRQRLGHAVPEPLSMWASSGLLWMLRPFHDQASRNWEVELKTFSLRYPCPVERDDDDVGLDYLMLRRDGATASLPPLLRLFPYSASNDPTDRFLVAAVRAQCGQAAAFERHGDELFVFKTVVNAVRHPDREIALEDGVEFDPECKVGDTLAWGVPPFGGLWTLLDWLRARRIPQS